jgi:chromosome segregation ATPase
MPAARAMGLAACLVGGAVSTASAAGPAEPASSTGAPALADVEQVIARVEAQLAVVDEAIRKGDERLDDLSRLLEETTDPEDRRRLDGAVVRLTSSLDAMEAKREDIVATLSLLKQQVDRLREGEAPAPAPADHAGGDKQ